MGRLALASVVLLGGVFASTAIGAPAVVIAKKPSLACPHTELGSPTLQARYKVMWEQYSAEVDEASKRLQSEIEKQTKSATGSGNLDLALFWKTIGNECAEKGELRWDEPSLKKNWNDRFGDASFPAEFSVAVKNASEAYASAREDLKKGYGELVADFTKAEKLEEALKLRSEIKEVLAETSSAPDLANTSTPMPKQNDLPQQKGWYVLFRSADPRVWDTQVTGDNSFASPLISAPKGIRYLKMSQNGKAVIIPMTNASLVRDGVVTKTYGWAGDNDASWGGYHLGIYDTRRPGAKNGDVIVVQNEEGFMGWGFGHVFGGRAIACSWGGQRVPNTEIEIAVKCTDLTPSERKDLLEE